jgi:hypothetical protein
MRSVLTWFTSVHILKLINKFGDVFSWTVTQFSIAFMEIITTKMVSQRTNTFQFEFMFFREFFCNLLWILSCNQQVIDVHRIICIESIFLTIQIIASALV